MRVVPSVVVDESRFIAHTGDLIAVVPPRHDARLIGSISSQPVVRLAEVVHDHAVTGIILDFYGDTFTHSSKLIKSYRFQELIF